MVVDLCATVVNVRALFSSDGTSSFIRRTEAAPRKCSSKKLLQNANSFDESQNFQGQDKESKQDRESVLC